jgi:hypothetical protein
MAFFHEETADNAAEDQHNTDYGEQVPLLEFLVFAGAINSAAYGNNAAVKTAIS